MGFAAGARLKYCLRRAVCQLLRLVEEMKKRERSESKCGDRGREDGGGELERISGKGELRLTRFCGRRRGSRVVL